MNQQTYRKRRALLAKRLPAHSVALIPAASACLRNGDVHYRFRQDSDFYYLTGFSEPDALLVIASEALGESILFTRPRHKQQEQWTGSRLGVEGVLEGLGIEKAHSLTEVEEILPSLFMGQHALYYAIGRYPRWEKQFFKAWQDVNAYVRRGIVAPHAFCDLTPLIGEMRVLKTKEEHTLLKEAARISVIAHEQAMRRIKALHYEHEIEAVLRYEFMRQGCRDVAYDPIVASGENACILHYTENNSALQKNALVLIDAGGEYQNYAADITRTFPINGRFSAEQRLIYELVYQAQKAALTCVKPGIPWGEMQRVIVATLTQGLVDLKILRGNVEGLVEQEAYKPFYMHQSGHWLGLDVHDSGAYKKEGTWRSLEPGMVLTVEPGLYIAHGIEAVDPRWWGIGVRIEDDIQVTPEGHENLTGHLAVTVDDIEAILRE